jgi:hypothetical protein
MATSNIPKFIAASRTLQLVRRAGYGAPTGIDASGNAYISNTILASNF